MAFTDIVTLLNTNFGKILVAILTLIVISLVKTTFIKNYTTKVIDNLLNKIKGGKRKTVSEQSLSVEESDVMHHDIFNYITFWLESNIPTMIFLTDFRTVVFKKYLVIFFETYHDNLKTFIKDGSYKKMSKSELKQELIHLLTNIIYDYELEMKKQGIPDVVILKMKEKNNETLNVIMELVNSITNSNFYDTEDNLLKMYSFLNIILAILDSIISNAETVCNNINGELKGLTMDGVTEPKHK